MEKTLHERFVDLYGLLEETWVGRNPDFSTDENCLVSGCVGVSDIGSYSSMLNLILDEARCDFAHEWNDNHSKEEVLAMVARCIAATAPAPADPFPSELPDLTPVI